ncbi:MAG: hypothetical protein Q9174_002265 [Haloplaca sp. 1 TL-2023]
MEPNSLASRFVRPRFTYPSGAWMDTNQGSRVPRFVVAETASGKTLDKSLKEEPLVVTVKEHTHSKPRKAPRTFLDLPYEIRTEIYELAFISCRQSPQPYAIQADQFLPLALMLTNWAVAEEAYQHYVKTLIVRVVVNHNEDPVMRCRPGYRATISPSGDFEVGLPFDRINGSLMACVPMKELTCLCLHMSAVWSSELNLSLARKGAVLTQNQIQT